MKEIKKIALLIGSCLILFFVITSGYSYTKNYLADQKTARELENAHKQSQILSDDLSNLGSFGKESSAENKKKYIDSVNQTLNDPALTEKTKATLLLRKAMILAVRRGSDASAGDRDEASDILKGFIFPPPGKTVTPYMRDFAVALFVHLQFQCCETRPFSSEIPQFYKPYADKGYSPRVAKLLVLNQLTESVSPPQSNDITIVANSILQKAELLTFHKSELQPEDLKKISDGLGEQIASIDSLEAKTYTDYIDTELEPLLFYAYGYDAYYSNRVATSAPLTAEQNATIDKGYDKAFEKFDEAEKQGVDKVGLNVMRLYNGFRYARSMDIRYADATKNPKMLGLIDSILSNINSNKEVKNIADSLFKANVGNTNSSIPGYFVGLSKKYPNIANYMSSIGIHSDSSQ